MKKIKDWIWDKENKVFVQDGFELNSLDENLGTDSHGDVTSSSNYSPSNVRWWNSFEEAQQMRFRIVMTRIRSRLLYIADIEKKKRKKLMIDLGCSRSFIYRRWRKNCNFFNWPKIAYWGVDSSLKRINQGRDSYVKKRNDSIAYFVGDLGEPMFFPTKADIIVCLEILEHIPEEKACNLLKTIYDHLSDNGSVIMSSPNPPEEGEWVWGKESQQSHHKEYTFGEAKDLLIFNGFEIVYHNGVLPYRNYNHQTSFKELRKELVKSLPAPLVNSMLLLAEPDMAIKRQWIIEAVKRKK